MNSTFISAPAERQRGQRMDQSRLLSLRQSSGASNHSIGFHPEPPEDWLPHFWAVPPQLGAQFWKVRKPLRGGTLPWILQPVAIFCSFFCFRTTVDAMWLVGHILPAVLPSLSWWLNPPGSESQIQLFSPLAVLLRVCSTVTEKY